MNKEEIKKKIEELGPWHYNLVIGGVSTGDSLIETLHPKLKVLLNANAFSRSFYPRVLDLGSNAGQISFYFADKGSSVDAIEFGPKYYSQLEFAIEQKGYKGRINPIFRDVSLGNFGTNQYDLILYLGTLHHLENDEVRRYTIKECHRALVPSGELIIQTKNFPVEEWLKEQGFINIHKLDTTWSDRFAWRAMKDPMKIEKDTRQQDLEKLLNIFGLENESQLRLLETCGMLVLMSHWMRGILDSLIKNKYIELNSKDAANWERVIENLQLYESFIWEITPSRLGLVGLRNFRLGDDLDPDFEKTLKQDAHGRIPYELSNAEYDDIKDIIRRLTDARQTANVGYGHAGNLLNEG